MSAPELHDLERGLLDEACFNAPMFETPMIDFHSELANRVPDVGKAGITIRHSPPMRAGYPDKEGRAEYLDSLFFAGSCHRVAHLVDFPLVDSPGTAFHKSSLTSHLPRVIVARACRTDLTKSGWENVFSQTGGHIAAWPVDSDGYTMGCIEIHLTARDMASVGVLYVNAVEHESQ